MIFIAGLAIVLCSGRDCLAHHEVKTSLESWDVRKGTDDGVASAGRNATVDDELEASESRRR